MKLVNEKWKFLRKYLTGVKGHLNSKLTCGLKASKYVRTNRLSPGFFSMEQTFIVLLTTDFPSAKPFIEKNKKARSSGVVKNTLKDGNSSQICPWTHLDVRVDTLLSFGFTSRMKFDIFTPRAWGKEKMLKVKVMRWTLLPLQSQLPPSRKPEQ